MDFKDLEESLNQEKKKRKKAETELEWLSRSIYNQLSYNKQETKTSIVEEQSFRTMQVRILKGVEEEVNSDKKHVSIIL